MNYALVRQGIVVNLIWLHPMNAGDFPDALPLEMLPVGIGDGWDGMQFVRNGVPLTMEKPEQQEDET